MAGIKESKELIKGAISALNGLGKSLEDGKLSLSDSVHFLQAARDLPAALSGSSTVFDELVDLDDAERKEIMDMIEKELDLPQDQAEQYLEAALKLLVSAADLLKFLKKDDQQ